MSDNKKSLIKTFKNTLLSRREIFITAIAFIAVGGIIICAALNGHDIFYIFNGAEILSIADLF